MKFVELLILALIAFGVWTTRRTVRRSASAGERTLAIRGALAFWLLGFVFLLGIVLLPMPWRLLLLLPGFLVGSTAIGAYRSARARLRAAEQERVTFERMKRAN